MRGDRTIFLGIIKIAVLVNSMKLSIESQTRAIRQCPKCQTQKVCRAHRNNKLDEILSVLNIYPYRCRQFPCKSRFYLFGRAA
jgi:hypothetical protein